MWIDLTSCPLLSPPHHTTTISKHILIVQKISACYTLPKCPWANSLTLTLVPEIADCAFSSAAQLTDMPQVKHHHPDDIMPKNACRMTTASPGLTFHPAAEMKPIRVSTCLCHFHVICICKPASPIAPRLHWTEEPIGQSEPLEEQMGAHAPASPALPDTLPWEKQHGPITGCSASSLSRRTSSTSAALCLQSYWIYR